jgi:hypothetical protein
MSVDLTATKSTTIESPGNTKKDYLIDFADDSCNEITPDHLVLGQGDWTN